MSLPRTLFLAAMPFPTRQGTQVFAAHLIGMLAQADVPLKVLTYACQDPSLPAWPTNKRSASPRRLSSGPAWEKLPLDLGLLGTAWRHTRAWRPEVIYAHNYEALLLALLLRAQGGPPVLYHAHNIMAAELPSYASHRLARILASITGQALDRLPQLADRLILFDERHRDYLRSRGVAPDKCSIIPPGLLAADPPCLSGPEPYTLSPVPPYILYCGNLDNYQNLDLLAAALPLVWRQFPDVPLVMATTASPTTALRWWLSHDLPPSKLSLLPLGGPSWQHNLLANSAAVVVPRAVWWGFPIKALNALRAGAVLVALRQSLGGALSDTEAVLCEPEAGSFARGIISAIGQKAAHDTTAAFRSRFSLEKQRAVYLDTLRRCANAG